MSGGDEEARPDAGRDSSLDSGPGSGPDSRQDSGAAGTGGTRDAASVPVVRVAWARTHRVIATRFPPIDLFDDVADPADWELLAKAESRTNPRIYEEIGDLSLVPPARRLAGPGASWVMGAFTHVSRDRASRFSDGGYGIYYAGESVATALCEHAFHMGRFYARTAEPEGWTTQVRELVGKVDADMTDLRDGAADGLGQGFGDLLDPDTASYPAPQRFAAALRASGSNGIVNPSRRYPGGSCIAAFWPDVVSVPAQGDHYRYHWSGERVNLAQRLTGERAVFELPDPMSR